jgi:hypothetical protein
MSEEEVLTTDSDEIGVPEASESDRLDEDDLDLLTFTEVAIRLDAEMASLRDQTAALRAAGNADKEVLARLDRRLSDLGAARTRLRRPQADG